MSQASETTDLDFSCFLDLGRVIRICLWYGS